MLVANSFGLIKFNFKVNTAVKKISDQVFRDAMAVNPFLESNLEQLFKRNKSY